MGGHEVRRSPRASITIWAQFFKAIDVVRDVKFSRVLYVKSLPFFAEKRKELKAPHEYYNESCECCCNVVHDKHLWSCRNGKSFPWAGLDLLSG